MYCQSFSHSQLSETELQAVGAQIQKAGADRANDDWDTASKFLSKRSQWLCQTVTLKQP